MYGKPAATRRPNTIALAPAADADPAPPARQAGDQPALAGDLTAELIREWGPVLKPTGLGLLVALHSFEERAPGHPYYGWAHCTQNALAAYLDTSQDTIARYTNLLQTCGLVQVEEVETPRGKQKLYRVARGLPLPSLGLLEYLVFEADNWTRKHTAWLAGGCTPLGPETELTRLTGIMERAYQVQIDARGLATIRAGARLTRPGSYRPRREPAAAQPPLLPPQESRSASCGQPGALQTPPAPSHPSAPCGQPGAMLDAQQADRSAPCGSAQVKPGDSGNQIAHLLDQSASGGYGEQGKTDESASGGQEESAPGGVGLSTTYQEMEKSGKESAPGGMDGTGESAASGVVPRPIVNVESILVNDKRNDNDNGAGVEPVDCSAPGGSDPEALVRWGATALGDEANLEWHRRCLAENGAERYRWAIDATLHAQTKSKVSKPGAYFTSLLRKRGGPIAAPATREAPPAVFVSEAAAIPAPVPTLSADPLPARAGLSEADCARTWQAALVHLRIILPADDYTRILRYAVLLELDRTAGWALLGLPADYMREQVEQRLAGPIAQALGQVCGAPVRVAAAVLSGQGRLAGARPTLQEWLTGRATS